jgi:sulfhydrogenase subunit alpha
MSNQTKTISVDVLTRVEGEGSLSIHLRDGKAEHIELTIFEPPRFFEGFLQGRSQLEVPDITARICGICPVAYQMSSCHAIEFLHQIVMPSRLRDLRRLLYCGEWIESHALHMFMLHAPDFLGFPDALTMAKHHPDTVKLGLRMKKAGNAIVRLLGGREIHPINVKVGGFYKLPSQEQLLTLIPEIDVALEALGPCVEWLASLPFPDMERDYEFVALHHPNEYPFCEGRIHSTKGMDIAISEYEQVFEELHVPYSTALHARIRERGAYFCGPLARFNLNFEQLPPEAQSLAKRIGLTPPIRNPFKSLLVRGIELYFAFYEARRIIQNNAPAVDPSVPIPVKAGTGFGATEAPRGLLYHRYQVDSSGTILNAKIVPPTSQNQKTIEDDLFELAPQLCEISQEKATLLAEQAIRNYDPCISCSTHFLKLKIVEG